MEVEVGDGRIVDVEGVCFDERLIVDENFSLFLVRFSNRRYSFFSSAEKIRNED